MQCQEAELAKNNQKQQKNQVTKAKIKVAAD